MNADFGHGLTRKERSSKWAKVPEVGCSMLFFGRLRTGSERSEWYQLFIRWPDV